MYVYPYICALGAFGPGFGPGLGPGLGFGFGLCWFSQFLVFVLGPVGFITPPSYFKVCVLVAAMFLPVLVVFVRFPLAPVLLSDALVLIRVRVLVTTVFWSTAFLLFGQFPCITVCFRRCWSFFNRGPVRFPHPFRPYLRVCVLVVVEQKIDEPGYRTL